MEVSLQAIAALFSTLSDPNRLAIIKGLTLKCESVSTIVERTGMSQPLVSHHLRVLREHGLARTERQGPFRYYWLSDIAVWETVEQCSRIAAKLAQATPVNAE